jgi:hypothetical protein
MREWTGVSAVASTTSLSAQERKVTARVAADGGDVAGTVTFTGRPPPPRASAWSVQVPVSRGVASVVVPSNPHRHGAVRRLP